MGCGIHLFTETLRHVNNKNTWLNCDNWKINHYYSPNDDDGETGYNINPLYDDRNYNLFAVLADVRNQSTNKFIDTPRGLPTNVSPQVMAESDSWDGDGHSHSHFTLDELKKFRQKNNIQKYSGLMTPENAKKVDSGAMPSEWCQGTNQEHYEYREWEQEGSPLDDLIERLDKRMRDDFWIFDKDDHPESDKKIRIIFWFDN